MSEATYSYLLPFGTDKDHMMGDLLDLSVIGNRTSRYPRSGSFRAMSVIGGKSRQLVEVSIRIA